MLVLLTGHDLERNGKALITGLPALRSGLDWSGITLWQRHNSHPLTPKGG
jgi:hypothetical protein